MEYVTLNNGVEMPILGFGVYQIPKEETKKCVLDAIKVGFRAIDTAQSYFNEAVAKKIANNLDADIFEIVPKDVYTSDDLNWSNDKSRVSREHNDESLRNVELETTTVDNWDNYDTILIGYPIWWGIAAWPVNTFVKANDFTNKTVIPFCTSASSDIGNSGKLLENDAKGGKWLTGQRFSSSPSDNDIKEFTDSIK